MSIEKIIPVDKELVNIFGVNDQNLKYLKDKFKKIKINVKGNVVYISGDNGQTTDIMKILDEMLSMAERGEIIEIEDLKLMSNIESKDISNISSSNNISIIGSKAIKVRNVTQFEYIEKIENSTINFGIGPAGTGKTFLAVASAVKMYTDEKIKKIVLTRPAVEAGERLGYLPGDLSQKIDPYLVPLFDSLEYFFGNETLQYLIEKRNIEIVPLSYMRGRTLNNACIITADEIKIDLNNREYTRIKKTRKSLSNIEEISVVEFKNSDIVRNKIVSKILEVFPDK